jgi:hypothetical protein
VQVPGALHFGRHDSGETLLIQVNQETIVKDSGSMDNTSEWRHRIVDLSKNRGHLFFSCYVRLGYYNPGTSLLQRLYRGTS